MVNKLNLTVLLLTLVFFSNLSCSEGNVFDLISMRPGNLGVSNSEELNCSEEIILQNLNSKLFMLTPNDSKVVNWWEDNGYNFLNYKCIRIYNNLFMVTLLKESDNSTTISIRSRYSFKKKEWIFASEFGSRESEKSLIAMEYIVYHLSNCSNI
jgi:hypothetical protein